MTEFTSIANCGNSPKMQLIEAFHRANAHVDKQTLLDMVTDDFQWDLIGSQSIYGKANFDSYLDALAEDMSIATYSLHTVLSHGRHGSANGEVQTVDGARMAFCDMIEFANAKGTQIKRIRRYLVPLT